jgi:UDP-N-acetylglucosamine diphosphorylase/glucosamine-1-phosphate N-acetyltransferase
MQPFGDLAAIILAAGKGTRMRSDKAKVLHEIMGRPMICHVVESARAVAAHVVVVIGHQAAQVRQGLGVQAALHFALQAQQLGTGHAVQCAMGSLPPETNEVLILCGDTPLIRPQTLSRLIRDHRACGAAMTLLTVALDDPYGYGRVITAADGGVAAIVEEADASTEQKQIRLVNAGIYCVCRNWLAQALTQLRDDNAQGEYYLTDILGIGHRQGVKINAWVGGDASELMGVNTIAQLADAERQMQRRSRESA